jgi:hypothetical protein
MEITEEDNREDGYRAKTPLKAANANDDRASGRQRGVELIEPAVGLDSDAVDRLRREIERRARRPAIKPPVLPFRT